GFVHQEHPRLAHDCATDRYALHLATGKPVGLALQQMFDAQGLGSLCYSGGDFLRSESPMLGLKWEFQILANGIVRIERVVLEHQCDVALGSAPVSDILAADRDAACIRRIQARD